MKKSARWNPQDGIRTIEARWNPHEGIRAMKSAGWNPQRNLHDGIQTMESTLN